MTNVEQAASERRDVAVIIHKHIWGSEYPSDEADCCADELLASDWLAAHDERIRAAERERLEAAVEALDDDICGALMAAKHGSYDGKPVERHLERLLDKFRAIRPSP